MASRLETLTTVLQASLGDLCVSATAALGELTVVVKAENLITAAEKLRDAPELRFEQLIDLCGMDYSHYGDAPASSVQGSGLRDANVRESGAWPSSAGFAAATGVTSPVGSPAPPSGGPWDGQRFAVVYHLLSISYNRRLRLRVFATDDDFPVVGSVIGRSANGRKHYRHGRHSQC